MRALTATELLSVWERGLAQSATERALLLLATASSETPREVLAKLSIGQRDACLLMLREWTFGPELVSLMTCPGCGERLELTFKVSDLQVETQTELAEALSLSVADYEVHFRLPNSLDLAAIAESDDVMVARHLLLRRCLLAVQHDGEEISAEQLPADVVEAVAERMAQADPQADVQLAPSCPSCDHEWQATFDIVSFFWSEIDAWAHRMLRELHTLASAYGWREADILAMSPWRRRFYLEMVSG